MVADPIPHSIEEPPYPHREPATAARVLDGCGHHLEDCIPEAHVIGASLLLLLPPRPSCVLTASLALLVEFLYTGPQGSLDSVPNRGWKLEATLTKVEETRCRRDEMD